MFTPTKLAKSFYIDNRIAYFQYMHVVAAACGYDLANHHVLADAEACAAIVLKIL